MFTFLVTPRSATGSLCWRWRASSFFWAPLPRAVARRCVSRPQPADRHHHDGSRRSGPAGSRAARHLPDRDPDERRAGRHPRALGLGRRAVDRLCRVRLGHRHLPQPPAGRRAARAGAEPAAAERHPADGADQLDHGPDPAGRGDSEDGIADGGARDRRLHDPAPAAHDPGRRAGDPDRRRGPPVSRRAAAVRVARARRHLRADREGADAVRHQHRRRLHRPALARIPDPQYRAHDQPGRPAQHRRCHHRGTPDPPAAGRDRRVCAQGQARRRRLHGQARRDRLGREAAQRRYRAADAADRGRRSRSWSPACRTASRPTKSCSGRRTSSRPRSTTSSGCCSKQPSSWPSCCSRSC